MGAWSKRDRHSTGTRGLGTQGWQQLVPRGLENEQRCRGERCSMACVRTGLLVAQTASLHAAEPWLLVRQAVGPVPRTRKGMGRPRWPSWSLAVFGTQARGVDRIPACLSLQPDRWDSRDPGASSLNGAR